MGYLRVLVDMRRFKFVVFSVFGSCLLLLILCVRFFAPTGKEARAARLIHAHLPPHASEKQVTTFLEAQDADCSTDTRPGHWAVFGRLPLVPPSSWDRYTRLGIPHERLESYDLGVGFYVVIDARGRMSGFTPYPPGVGPYAEPWRDLP